MCSSSGHWSSAQGAWHLFSLISAGLQRCCLHPELLVAYLHLAFVDAANIEVGLDSFIAHG